jgi:hypothetical protein
MKYQKLANVQIQRPLFWIDTLCVPRKPVHLRNQALSWSKDRYTKSTNRFSPRRGGRLVPNLLYVDAPGACRTGIFSAHENPHLKMDARLWTLGEAMLPTIVSGIWASGISPDA